MEAEKTFVLENDWFSIEVSNFGAQLKKVYHKPSNTSLLWDGDPVYWGKTSPVLFPIVGTLKDNQYELDGQTYKLGRHGFARDRLFSLDHISDDELSLILRNDERSLEVYPFEFHLKLTYRLHSEMLEVLYQVKNTSGNYPLYFSLGAHPAFQVPLEGKYEDYYLEFKEDKSLWRYPLTNEGLLTRDPEKVELNDKGQLSLSHELFYNDALVITSYQTKIIKLGSRHNDLALYFDRGNFPHLGIWSAKDAPFICIEPWQGHADYVDTSSFFSKKEGVIELGCNELWSDYWRIGFR